MTQFILEFYQKFAAIYLYAECEIHVTISVTVYCESQSGPYTAASRDE